MEALNMAAQILLEKDDVVLVESPTFVQSIQTFELLEAKCIACKTDNDGYIIADVEEKIKTYSPKAIYVIPTFQNPTGRTTSLERRIELAKLANRYGIVVIEDDPYAEMRYSGKDLPPVIAYDEVGKLYLCQQFIKNILAGVQAGLCLRCP